MKILKLSTGLDPGNLLDSVLGSGFEVVGFRPDLPVTEQVRDADVLLLRDVPVPAEVIDAALKLKLLQRYGQHFMGVDIGHALRKGIYVARIPADVSRAYEMVAEHAFFLLMATAKRLPEATRSVAERVVGVPETVSIVGKKLGLVGVGKTGEVLARLARGVGMEVLAVKRTIDLELKAKLALTFLGTISQIDLLLGEADFISLHLPLDPTTKGFLGEREFRMMKPGSCLINIARAEIVDKAALYEALASGHVAGAGLDVFWEEPANPRDPLLKLPNVLLTPHIAGGSRETYLRLAEAAAENIRAVACGAKPNHLVLSEADA